MATKAEDQATRRLPLADRIAKKLGFVRATELESLISTVLAGQATGISPEKSYSSLVDSYRSWVYTAIDKISKTVAMLPLKLYVYRSQSGVKIEDTRSIRAEEKAIGSKGERQYFLKQMNVTKEQVYAHPFHELMNRPNMIMTRMTLWYETMIRLELSGMCGWYMPVNRLGLPGEIWPLPLTKTATFQPVPKPTMEIDRWIYKDGNINLELPPEEVLLHKYPNPSSPYQGMSPLMAQTYPYDLDLYLMIQQSALYQNKGVPGLHLHTDQRLTKPQVDEIRQQLMEMYGGAIRSGLPMVTHSGLTADKTAFSPREAQTDKVAKYAREKLITAYDLSEGKLGLVDDVNRANMEALNETFVTECLKPKCMLIEEVIEAFLLPRYDVGLTCDFDLPDIGDREYDLKERETNLRTLFSSINEERAKEGLAPVPWGEKPWVPMNMIQEGGGVLPQPAKEDGASDHERMDDIEDLGDGDAGEQKAGSASDEWNDAKKNGSGRSMCQDRAAGSAR